MSVDEYIAKSTEINDDPPVKVTKKRKTTADRSSDHDALIKRARLHCKCPEQWKTVSRYNSKRLEEFVQEQDFMNSQQLYESIFGFAHRLLGLLMDTITKADGHVQREIENDLSLRHAIEQEGSLFVNFLTNRFKIAALTTIDTFNGKQLDIKSRPAYVEADEDCETNNMDGQDIREQATSEETNNQTDETVSV
jgi:hypothetical protein